MYNTSVVISPDGEIIAKYRKMFPWLPYEAGTAAGDTFCVFDIPNIGRFGLCICYDMWFPEVSRQLAWMGAEAIIQPTLTPTSDRSLELVMARANALFNQCYFFSINGIGEWGGGRSTIIDPDVTMEQPGLSPGSVSKRRSAESPEKWYEKERDKKRDNCITS